jgi:2-haloacid dehalogenase
VTVEALVFDLYGTLLDVRSLEHLCAAETGDGAAVVSGWRQKQLEYTWLRAAMGRYEDFWAVTADALDYTLERRARALAVLSNGSPDMLDRALRAAGLHEVFAHVLSVDEVKTYKPSAAVYLLPERRLRLPRAGILFVSSNAWDAAGAKAFGLPVAWVNRTGAPVERLGFVADVVVRDLAELAAGMA